MHITFLCTKHEYIDLIYEPPYAKNKAATDPSVKPRGELAIGFGAGGSSPQTFTLPDNRDADVSYLKVFLSKEYQDLSYIAQESPLIEYDDERAIMITKKTPDFDRLSVEQRQQKWDQWDTIFLPIAQRKIKG
jgi:hypothetical protein